MGRVPMGARTVKEPRSIRLVEDRWATIRHVVEAVAIVGAALWAFYVFVYQERIKPASATPPQDFISDLKLQLRNLRSFVRKGAQ